MYTDLWWIATSTIGHRYWRCSNNHFEYWYNYTAAISCLSYFLYATQVYFITTSVFSITCLSCLNHASLSGGPAFAKCLVIGGRSSCAAYHNNLVLIGCGTATTSHVDAYPCSKSLSRCLTNASMPHESRRDCHSLKVLRRWTSRTSCPSSARHFIILLLSVAS